MPSHSTMIDAGVLTSSLMSQHLDYFSDMLAEGENIRAAVAGPGASMDGATVWFQFAATENRVLVVELHMSPTGSYRPVQRLHAQSHQIQVNRYPKSEGAVSRLELHGFDIPSSWSRLIGPMCFRMWNHLSWPGVAVWVVQAPAELLNHP